MKKPILLILGAVIIMAAAIIGFLFLRSNEDTWLCKDGQWVAHGHPSAPKPTSGCEKVTLPKNLSGNPTLPNTPNKKFSVTTPSTSLNCTDSSDVDAQLRPAFTAIFGEVAVQLCNECGKKPICIEYVPKYMSGESEIIALENKLLFSGFTEYDARKTNSETKDVTFGVKKVIGSKAYGVFCSFNTTRQSATCMSD